MLGTYGYRGVAAPVKGAELIRTKKAWIERVQYMNPKRCIGGMLIRFLEKGGDTLEAMSGGTIVSEISVLTSILRDHMMIQFDPPILCLRLRKCNIIEKKIDMLCKGLGLNTSIQHLDLSQNDLYPDGVKQISEALFKRRERGGGLKTLNLSNTCMAVGRTVMLTAMGGKEYKDDQEGMKHLGAYLALNDCEIEYLDISHNNIGHLGTANAVGITAALSCKRVKPLVVLEENENLIDYVRRRSTAIEAEHMRRMQEVALKKAEEARQLKDYVARRLSQTSIPPLPADFAPDTGRLASAREPYSARPSSRASTADMLSSRRGGPQVVIEETDEWVEEDGEEEKESGHDIHLEGIGKAVENFVLCEYFACIVPTSLIVSLPAASTTAAPTTHRSMSSQPSLPPIVLSGRLASPQPSTYRSGASTPTSATPTTPGSVAASPTPRNPRVNRRRSTAETILLPFKSPFGVAVEEVDGNEYSLLEKLDFRSVNLRDEGVLQVAAVFDEGVPVRNICLRNNHITGSAVQRLLSGVRVAKIHTLDLSMNDLGSLGAKYIAEALRALSQTLQSLDISNCRLTDNGKNFDGVLEIVHALKENRMLSHLYLRQNNLIPQSYAAHQTPHHKLEFITTLIDVLKRNVSLISLDLSGNRIDKPAQLRLLEVIREPRFQFGTPCAEPVKEALDAWMKQCFEKRMKQHSGRRFSLEMPTGGGTVLPPITMPSGRKSPASPDASGKRKRRLSIFGGLVEHASNVDQLLKAFQPTDNSSAIGFFAGDRGLYGTYPEMSSYWLRPRLIRSVLDFLGEPRSIVF